MISKSNKFIKYASVAALAIVALAASLSSNNINLSKNILRGRASDTIHGSITFSRATGTQVVRSNNYYYTSGSTTNGAAVYLRNASNVSLGTSYVAVMCGNSEKGSIDPEIIFTAADSGTSQFGFQYISSISAVSNSSNSRTLIVSKSSNGSSWNDAGTMAVTSSGGSNTDVAGAKYIKLSYSGLFTLYLTSFTINYYCSASGTPDIPGEKTLSSISVKTTPTTTTYYEGEYFDPSGLVITAAYSDLTSEDIEYDGNESDFSFSPSLSTSLTTSDESVIITYKGKSASQSILVRSNVIDPVGVYTLQTVDPDENSRDMTLTISNGGTGTFVINSAIVFEASTYYTTNFTWTFNENTNIVTFTYATGGTGNSNAYKYFKMFEKFSSGQTNTGLLTVNSITITFFNGGTSTTIYKN